MPLAYLINIVNSTLVYTVVTYHIGTFDKCICRIYNDIINYCCTTCQHACVRVCAIVTVARAVQSLVVMENTFRFLKDLLYLSLVIIIIKKTW